MNLIPLEQYLAPEVFEWIYQAVMLIRQGVANTMKHPHLPLLVYKCGTIIRIDMKQIFEQELH
jgi:hypothetical protein